MPVRLVDVSSSDTFGVVGLEFFGGRESELTEFRSGDSFSATSETWCNEGPRTLAELEVSEGVKDEG